MSVCNLGEGAAAYRPLSGAAVIKELEGTASPATSDCRLAKGTQAKLAYEGAQQWLSRTRRQVGSGPKTLMTLLPEWPGNGRTTAASRTSHLPSGHTRAEC